MRLTVPVCWSNGRINKAEHLDQPAEHIYTHFNPDSLFGADFPKQQQDPSRQSQGLGFDIEKHVVKMNLLLLLETVPQSILGVISVISHQIV